LFWDGVVNRQELPGRFGISLRQASADFADFARYAAYNRAANGYVRSDVFDPRLTTPDAALHLAHLQLAGEGIVDSREIGLGQTPPFDIVPGPVHRVDPLVLRKILEAIRGRRAIEITYRSMSRPEPERRWIALHTLAFDAFRWRARALCARDQMFNDFVLIVLTRMSSPGETRTAAIDPDEAWRGRVRVIMRPHPGLSEGQRKAVEADYGMTGSVSVIDVRDSADRFDPRIGTKFATYAIWWIRQGIMRAVADTGRIIRIPVHVHENLRKFEKARLQAQYESGRESDAERIAVLAALPPDTVRKLMRVPEDPVSMDSEPEVVEGIGGMADEERPSPEAALITAGMQALVRQQLDRLEPREESVIRQRFGIGCDDHTLEEVGQMYGVTRERIRQIESKALKKLGHPGHAKRLRDEL
jgi:RNA polymerase sigma factor (sigma-70 family)